MPASRAAALAALLVLAAAAAASSAAGRAVPDAFVPAPPAGELLPAPQEVAWGRGAFTINARTSRIVLADPDGDDRFAARELIEELRALGGPALRVAAPGEVASAAGHLLIGEPEAHPLLARTLRAAGLSPVTRPEGYLLRVTPREILVAGADARGTFYGVQTLRQLLRLRRGRTIPEVLIRDWPDHPLRAVHLLLDDASDPFHVELLDRILAPHKINTLVVEAEHVQWESGRPFWSPDRRGATKAQVRRLLAAAREHHIQVIPLIATLGHSEWVFAGLRDEALCRQAAHSPAGEVTCDRARGVYPAVYNPDTPIVVEGRTTTLQEALILPVLREAVELFRPAFLHLGHDEVRGPSGLRYDMRLYLRSILTLSAALREMGVRPMIWGDVLWERREEVAADPQGAQLPRDLVIVPWKYEDVAAYPEVAHFRREGFDVLGATWWRLHNTVSFSRAVREAGGLGMIRTTWTGHFQNRAALTRAYRQLYTYLGAAAYFWNADAPPPEAFPGEPALARRFAEAWRAGAGAPAQPASGTLLNLAPLANASHVDADGTGWQGKGPDYDLRALRPGRHRAGGILFEVLDPARHRGRSVIMLRGERDVAQDRPSRVTVRMGLRAACLAVVHAALDRAPSFGDPVGRYIVRLAGGAASVIELRYGQNISSWLWDAERGIPSIEQEVAWSGRTAAGNEVLLQMIRWRNPQPETLIEAIELRSAGGRASPVVFAITALDRCP
ncbi:MAG TPA: glycoside hydrolase family 20 zincin-like fold domain-containing protein [bacterium]|nr:glycoside hydrolase family 20 zincin-like fold domain-containing protein [bacterium]